MYTYLRYSFFPSIVRAVVSFLMRLRTASPAHPSPPASAPAPVRDDLDPPYDSQS